MTGLTTTRAVPGQYQVPKSGLLFLHQLQVVVAWDPVTNSDIGWLRLAREGDLEAWGHGVNRWVGKKLQCSLAMACNKTLTIQECNMNYHRKYALYMK